MLEARDRIGGRIFTHRDPATPVPIELGAEFIHGAAPELDEIAPRRRLAAVDISGCRWQSIGDKLRPADEFWERSTASCGASTRSERPIDRFENFLAEKPGGRRLATIVGSHCNTSKDFHAADPARISERALAEGGSPAATFANDASVACSTATIASSNGSPHHSAIASGVRRSSPACGGRRATCPSRRVIRMAARARRVDARAAIVAVPLGVLQGTSPAKSARSSSIPSSAPRRRDSRSPRDGIRRANHAAADRARSGRPNGSRSRSRQRGARHAELPPHDR